MTRALVLIIFLATVANHYAATEIIEISLPALHGTYPLDDTNGERTASFQLPQPPIVINGAWFRISGTAEVGAATCEWGGPYPWAMDFFTYMTTEEFNRIWLATENMPEEDGEFGWIAEFRPSPRTTTWSFLMDGEGKISLFGAPAGLVDLCHPATPPPTGTVAEAVLIIDAEFPVPVRQSTWGRIKALFE